MATKQGPPAFKAGKEPSIRSKKHSAVSIRRTGMNISKVLGLSGTSMHRGSLSFRAPLLRFAPTYRLEAKHPLNREMCENIIKRVMEQVLEDYQYTSKYAQILCKHLSEEVKTRIKIQNFDRYKLVCLVTIGEKFLQGYNSMVAFLWDSERDGYISCVHDTPTFFVVVTLYYFYYD